MFDLGDGDKDELEKNMEEIKQLVDDETETTEDIPSLENEPEVEDEEVSEPETDTDPEEEENQLDREFEEMRSQLRKGIESLEQRQEEVDRSEEDDSTDTEKHERESADPIFLEVEEFEDMKRRVKEMNYLTSEAGEVVRHLKSGIEKDESTVEETRDILDDFEDRRGSMKSNLNEKK